MITDSTPRDHPAGLTAGWDLERRKASITITVSVERASTEEGVMAAERLPLRRIREILRLKWTLNRSHREMARSLGVSPGAVASVLSRPRLAHHALQIVITGVSFRARRACTRTEKGMTVDRVERRFGGVQVAPFGGRRSWGRLRGREA